MAACACLLLASVLQAPAAVSAAGSGETGTAAVEAQGAPSGKPAPPNRQPSGQRDGRPGSGSSGLIDDDRRWAWWDDAEVRRELGLTDAKVQAIVAILRERWQASRTKAGEFMREREKLNRMLSDPATTETGFELQVLKVDRLRSELETGRTMMLYRMLKQLSPDQVKKLEQIAERRNARDGRR